MGEATDEALDREFAYTAWNESCKSPWGLELNDHDAMPTILSCRRRRGHVGAHATGFGDGRKRWDA